MRRVSQSCWDRLVARKECVPTMYWDLLGMKVEPRNSDFENRVNCVEKKIPSFVSREPGVVVYGLVLPG